MKKAGLFYLLPSTGKSEIPQKKMPDRKDKTKTPKRQKRKKEKEKKNTKQSVLYPETSLVTIRLLLGTWTHFLVAVKEVN